MVLRAGESDGGGSCPVAVHCQQTRCILHTTVNGAMDITSSWASDIVDTSHRLPTSLCPAVNEYGIAELARTLDQRRAWTTARDAGSLARPVSQCPTWMHIWANMICGVCCTCRWTWEQEDRISGVTWILEGPDCACAYFLSVNGFCFPTGLGGHVTSKRRHSKGLLSPPTPNE